MKNRKEKLEFLQEHERYYTINSWNKLDSFSKNMKVYQVIPKKYQAKVYELIETEDFYEEINLILKDYEIRKGLKTGFNGRSGGYLVLYNKDGTARGCDYNIDYNNIDDENLNSLYNDVKEFDNLCNEVVNHVIHLAKYCNIKEEVYTIEKKRKVIEFSK